MAERSKPLPHQLLWEARQIAERHGMYIVEAKFARGREKVAPLILYRKNPAGGNQRVGKRSDPEAMLAFVKTFEPRPAKKPEAVPA